MPQIVYAVAIADVCGFVWQPYGSSIRKTKGKLIVTCNDNYVKFYNKVCFGRFTIRRTTNNVIQFGCLTMER